MSKLRALWAVALGGALVMGCKKEETPATPTTPSTPSQQPVPQSNSTTPATLPAIPPLPTAPGVPAVPSSRPADAAAVAPDAASADAQKLMEQIHKDIHEKKWDAADADMKKLEGMKDQLSTQMQTAVTGLRTQLDASKAASSLKIPGLGTDSNNK
ncbi:MAG TPA: hypothetical protein VG269_22410 [Tepidisphaeraceae bacterium]|jgi:hypothetical protein|nr:hypothetical protein [Tepidisphaeraceae bacterium]